MLHKNNYQTCLIISPFLLESLGRGHLQILQRLARRERTCALALRTLQTEVRHLDDIRSRRGDDEITLSAMDRKAHPLRCHLNNPGLKAYALVSGDDGGK